MTVDAPTLRIRLLREIRAAKRRAVADACLRLAPALCVAGTLASGAVALPPAAVSASRAACVVVAGLVILAGRRAATAVESAGFAGIARGLARDASDVDLLAAGAHVLTDGADGRLSPLVADAAERLAVALPAGRRAPIPVRSVFALIAAIVVAWGLCRLFPKDGVGLGHRLATDASALFAPASDSRPSPPTAAESAPTAATKKEEVPDVAITVVSDRRIYTLEAPIELTFGLDVKRPATAAVPIEVRLGVSDGLPYPDAGFGDGFRVLSIPLGWSVGTEPGLLKRKFGVLEHLKSMGIYRPGLFTFVVAAAPLTSPSPIDPGIMGNTLVVQVAENVEDLSARLRVPMGSKEEKEKKEPSKEAPKKGDTEGSGVPPALGAPDRLPEARRVGVAVEPLFNDGPTIEKDVSVWEREKGGDTPPPPPPAPPPAAPASRTPVFKKETDLVRPAFSPADRDAVRRYFERLNRRNDR
jgi:hypothetical protein